MSTTTISIASVLNSLIEACKDGQDGFRSAAENVQSDNFKSLFVELATQRQLFVGELRRLVTAVGEEPQTAGSIGATLHRGWIDLKAAMTSGNEHAILAECERGEDAAMAAYQEALQHGELPDDIRWIIERQSVGVNSAHDRVRELRDRFKDEPARE